MEVFFALILVAIVIFGVQGVINLASRGADYAGRQVKKAVTGTETGPKTKTAMGQEPYFGPGELRLVATLVGDTNINAKLIQFRGKIPNSKEKDLSYVISAFDSTKGGSNLSPVISLAEAAMEPDTVAFQGKGEIGRVSPGNAFTDWVQFGAIIPDFIQPPFSGVREITVVLRFVDTNDPPVINTGYVDNPEKTIGYYTVKFSHNFQEKGYEEAQADRERTQALALKLGVAVAMADGALADDEGTILKSYIKRQIGTASGAHATRLKELLNNTLRDAFSAANEGRLSLTQISEQLSEVATKREKYEAIELSLDIMAADGVADPAEVAIIREMATALDLDMAEVEQMREKVTLNLSANLTSEEGLESLVGLDPNWSEERKRRHLRSEFQKWSNRLNALPEGEDRKAAQDMLDKIALLRSKYGGT